MASDDKKPPSRRRPADKETGVLTERADLANPAPAAADPAEEQVLLPHERDQTTRPGGTGESTEHEHSREMIEQAGTDTRRGLKDTDRRGIPSDIVAAEIPPADAEVSDLAPEKRTDQQGNRKKTD